MFCEYCSFSQSSLPQKMIWTVVMISGLVMMHSATFGQGLRFRVPPNEFKTPTMRLPGTEIPSSAPDEEAAGEQEPAQIRLRPQPIRIGVNREGRLFQDQRIPPAQEPADSCVKISDERLGAVNQESGLKPCAPPQQTTQNNAQGNGKLRDGVQWSDLLAQSLLFTSVMHGFRIATEPSTRGDLKGPFFRDYLSSLKRLRGWRDGDSLLINYIGHPMEGAVSGRIYLHNEAARDIIPPALGKEYVKSRVRAMGWAFVVSAQFELGPFSEASLGNVGMRPSETSPHPLSYVDIIVTPALGTVWLIGEDVLDQYLIRKIERWTSNRILRALARSFLNPARSFANLMRFQLPWRRDGRP
jgi:hypothetical protein